MPNHFLELRHSLCKEINLRNENLTLFKVARGESIKQEKARNESDKKYVNYSNKDLIGSDSVFLSYAMSVADNKMIDFLYFYEQIKAEKLHDLYIYKIMPNYKELEI